MKTKVMKHFCIILVIAFMGTLSGCTPKVTKPTTNSNSIKDKVVLRVYAQYSTDDEKQPFDYAKAQMKNIMPNVELDLEVMAQDDNQKIKTYAATKNLPDIFVATTDIIESFKKSNNILKLDTYVKELGIEEQFLPSSIPLLKDAKGNTWAIPDAGQFAALLYYNKDVFTNNGVNVPTNYAEFLSAVKKFKANKVVPLALFAKEKWPGVQLFDMLASREDPKGITKLDLGQGKASDPAFKNAATKLLELVKAGLLPQGAFNLSSDDAGAQFKQGKAAMYLSGAWSMSDLGSMGENVGILYYPLADKNNASSAKWNMSGGGYNSGLAVSPYSKNKDIAAKYACQFALKFAEGRILKRGDPNPILKNTPKPENGYNSIQQQYVNDSASFKTMTCFDWGITNAKFKASIEDEVNTLLSGDYTVADFVKNIDKVIDQSK